MKRNNIFFGFLIVTIAVIVGMHKYTPKSTNSSIMLIKDGRSNSYVNYSNGDNYIISGPKYTFNRPEKISQCYKNSSTPRLNLGEGIGYKIYGSSKNNKRTYNNNNTLGILGTENLLSSSKSNISISNSNLVTVNSINRKFFNNTIATTQGNPIINNEPFVQTGPMSFVAPEGEDPDGPVTPIGGPIIPLILFSSLWVLYRVFKKK